MRAVLFIPLFFLIVFQHHWRDRRRFFVDYAKKMEFDPYVPQNWYSVSLKSVLQQKVFFLF